LVDYLILLGFFVYYLYYLCFLYHNLYHGLCLEVDIGLVGMVGVDFYSLSYVIVIASLVPFFYYVKIM